MNISKGARSLAKEELGLGGRMAGADVWGALKWLHFQGCLKSVLGGAEFLDIANLEDNVEDATSMDPFK